MQSFLSWAKANRIAIHDVSIGPYGDVSVTIADTGIAADPKTTTSTAAEQEKGWRELAGPAFDAIVANGGNPVRG